MTEITMSRRRTRIEVHGTPKRREQLLGASFHHRGIAERNLAPWIGIVERDRLHHLFAAGMKSLGALDPAIMRGEYEAERQQASRPRVVRIGVDRPLQRRDRRRLSSRLSRQTWVCARATRFPRVQIIGRLGERAHAFGSQQARLDRRDDAAR